MSKRAAPAKRSASRAAKNARKASPTTQSTPDDAKTIAAKRRRSPTTEQSPQGAAQPSLAKQVEGVLAWLKKHSSKATRDGMSRFAIPSENAYGVTMKDVKALAKSLGRSHELAHALWATDVYEARLLVSMVADPAQLTTAEMDKWCNDFDSWAICDTMCFNLFDRTPLAWGRVEAWSRRTKEFEKRTAFALLWSLALHDKLADDKHFLNGLTLIERESGDARNFVKKAVNMALRAIGRRNRTLHAAALATARRLAESSDATARWNGKDALRELSKSASK